VSTPLLRTLLFISSFAPLPVVLAARLFGSNYELSLLWLAAAVALTILAAAAFRLLSRSGTSEFTLQDVEPQREAFATYLLGYVLPFVLIDLDDRSAVTAALVFVLILGLVSVRSNLIYLNPLLALAGYRLYAVSAIQSPGPKEPIRILLLSREPHITRGDRFVVGGEDADVRVARSRIVS
jgi:hypothetical protein